MTRNIGQSSLRRKRRGVDPMAAYDTLPAELRQWLSQAALPWSPTSARRIWIKSRRKGMTTDEILGVLSLAEARTLAQDRFANLGNAPVGDTNQADRCPTKKRPERKGPGQSNREVAGLTRTCGGNC